MDRTQAYAAVVTTKPYTSCMQVPVGADEADNPFHSVTVLNYYLGTWIDQMCIWSMVDPRRDPVRNRAAGVQEGVFAYMKRRVGTARLRTWSVIDLTRWLAVAMGPDQPYGYLQWDAKRFSDAHKLGHRSALCEEGHKQAASQPESETVWRRPAANLKLATELALAMQTLKSKLERSLHPAITGVQLCSPASESAQFQQRAGKSLESYQHHQVQTLGQHQGLYWDSCQTSIDPRSP